MLNPAGPDDEEGDAEDEEEATDGEAEREEECMNMEEYKHAMLELEGLKVSETHANIQDQKDEKGDITEEEATSTAKSDEETGKELEEELKEAEDECPELTDLSAFNKEFKPFR